MKTELIITQGRAKLVLTCESEFEIDLIEKIKDSRIGYDAKTSVLTDYNYHTHSNHRIEVNLVENKE